MFKACRDFLNELHECGVFKELHIYFFTLYNTTFDAESVAELIAFNGLTKVSIQGMKGGIDLSPLINLKHLCVNIAFHITNMDTLAIKLINLESIQFTYANMDEIIPFIRHSVKLNTIIVFNLHKYFEIVSKIKEINEERCQKQNAKKITIFVKEKVYLTVKWAKHQIEWSLIEIKRGKSYDALNHDFNYNDYLDMIF